MPIIKHKGKVCHFAHIPKCAGTTIEAYFQKVNLSVAFLDTQYYLNPAPKKWNISSPQHIDGYSLSRLFPKDFFDIGFAIIRNPVDRFFSAFEYQMSARKIASEVNADDFIQNDLEKIIQEIGLFDNHFFPQVRFFMPGIQYNVFKLESGLNDAKSFIDNALFGADLPEKIEHYNKEKNEKEKTYLADASIKRLKEIYAEDYEKLPYE